MMLTKEVVYELLDENITVKRQNHILDLIDKKFGEICDYIFVKDKYSWYDYSNCSYDDVRSEGYFDIKSYNNNIFIVGDNLKTTTGYENFSFPTRWLWEKDWKSEFDQSIEKEKVLQIKKKMIEKNTLKTELKN